MTAQTATHRHADPAADEMRRWVEQQNNFGVDRIGMHEALIAAGWDAVAANRALDDALAPAQVPAPASALPGPDLADSPTQLLAHDRNVGVLLAIDRPPLVVFEGLLDEAECEALIDASRPRLARSRTVQRGTGDEEINPDRTSDGTFFHRGENALVQRIEARIASLLRWPVDHGEGLQILHYQPGAEYKPHHDYFDPAEAGSDQLLRRGGQRVGTLVMYLNTPQAGGATVFPALGMQVLPRRGNAVFFAYDRPHPSTRTLHGGAPVLAGEKWIATKWLRASIFE